jgi:uncharacterized protein with HEPN domain
MKPSEFDRDIHLIGKIKKYCDDIFACAERFGKSKEAFSADTIYQHACAMCILQIGELANHLSESFRAGHGEILWRQIIDMRNIMAHDYAKLDLTRTWASIEIDVPELRAFCEAVSRNAKNGNEKK